MDAAALLLSALASFAATVEAAAAATQTSPRQDPQVSGSQVSAPDAYLDATARRLMLGMRAERDAMLSGIDAYTALLRERMSLEMPFRQRTLPFVSGEFVSRIRWSRTEPTVVSVLESRMREPDLVPRDRSDYSRGPRAGRFGADPLADPFSLGVMGGEGSAAQCGTQSAVGGCRAILPVRVE